MIFDENDLLEEMYNIGEEETDQLLGLILDFLKSYDKERDKNLLLLAEKLIKEKRLLMMIKIFSIRLRRWRNRLVGLYEPPTNLTMCSHG